MLRSSIKYTSFEYPTGPYVRPLRLTTLCCIIFRRAEASVKLLRLIHALPVVSGRFRRKPLTTDVLPVPQNYYPTTNKSFLDAAKKIFLPKILGQLLPLLNCPPPLFSFIFFVFFLD